MSTQDNRAPEDIEGEIEHTRSEMRETLDAIQSRFTPAQMMDEAMNYFRNGPGEFASNLGRVVRNNPVPVALVGVGLAWLAVSSTRRTSGSDQDEYDYDQEGYDYTSAGAGDYPAMAESDYTSAGGAYRSPPGSASYGTAGAAYAAGSSGYSSSSGSAYESGWSGDSGGYYGESSSDYGDSSQEERGRMGRLADSARGRMSRIGGMARDQGQRARDGLTGMAEQQPVMMAAAAFAIGAALGALLPSTRREDEWMGQTRDNLKHRATAAGREGIDRAGRVAEETWTAVGDEALNPGVARDGGGMSGSSTTSSRSTSSSAPSTASKSSAGASASVKSGEAAGTTPSSAAGGTSSGTTSGKKAPDTKPV